MSESKMRTAFSAASSYALRGIGVGGLALLAGCGSQTDSVSLGLDEDARRSPAGIFDAVVSFSTPDREADWRFLLAQPTEPGEPARVVGYNVNTEGSLDERAVVGQYRSGAAQSVTGSLRFYDIISEVPEDAEDDPDTEVDESEQEELRRRVRPLTFNGIFDPRERFNVLFTGQSADGDNIGDGTIDGSYDEVAYERLSTLTAIAGSWREPDQFGFDEAQFGFVDDGGVAGSAPDPVSERTCQYEGRLDVVDPRFNLYAIRLQQSQCGRPPSEFAQPPSRSMVGLVTLGDIDPGDTPAEAQEMIIVIGSAPLVGDGSAEARVFRLRRSSSP